jgi:hypothetical protein
MNTISNKQLYTAPTIECVKLDNEISLVLMSGASDPGDPIPSGGIVLNAPEYFNNDPFHNNLG